MSYDSNCQINSDDSFVNDVMVWLNGWFTKINSPLGFSDFLYYNLTESGRKSLKAATNMYNEALKRVTERQKMYAEDANYQKDKSRLGQIF